MSCMAHLLEMLAKTPTPTTLATRTALPVAVACRRHCRRPRQVTGAGVFVRPRPRGVLALWSAVRARPVELESLDCMMTAITIMMWIIILTIATIRLQFSSIGMRGLCTRMHLRWASCTCTCLQGMLVRWS